MAADDAMQEAKVEEVIRKQPQTEFDAAHPRFTGPLTPEEIKACEINMYYFCETCNIYFAATVEGLNYHFRGGTADHRPIGPCFYCQGPVFTYMFRSEKQFYHNCRSGT